MISKMPISLCTSTVESVVYGTVHTVLGEDGS